VPRTLSSTMGQGRLPKLDLHDKRIGSGLDDTRNAQLNTPVRLDTSLEIEIQILLRVFPNGIRSGSSNIIKDVVTSIY